EVSAQRLAGVPLSINPPGLGSFAAGPPQPVVPVRAPMRGTVAARRPDPPHRTTTRPNHVAETHAVREERQTRDLEQVLGDLYGPQLFSRRRFEYARAPRGC